MSLWSIGVRKTESSIYNAYIQCIANAKHFIYIENQFFISNIIDERNPIQNKIADALFLKIVK